MQPCPGVRYPNGQVQPCGSQNFTPVQGESTTIAGFVHAIALCENGHRVAVPVLGPRCSNCGHQEAIRAGGDQHVPTGALNPLAVQRFEQGGSQRQTMQNAARAAGIGGVI